MKEFENLTQEEMELLSKMLGKGTNKKDTDKVEVSESEQMSIVFAMVLQAKGLDFDKVIEYSEIFALWQAVWETKGLRELIVSTVGSKMEVLKELIEPKL